MIVICPTCAARYNMNPNYVNPDNGRIVRCSSCGHSWRIFREQEQSDDSLQSKPQKKTTHQPAQKISNSVDDKDKKEKKSLFALMIGLNFFIFLFLTFGYLMRQEIVKILPQTERFYQILGINVDITGISLVMPYLEKIEHPDGHVSLLIQGSFLNSHPKNTLAIPPLRVVLLNQANLPITNFIKSDFNPATLPPGGVSVFTFEIPKLPQDAVDVFIEFNHNK